VCARETGRPGHRISLRVSDELYQAISELAKHDRRPLTMWVRQRLEDAVAAARAAGTGGAGTRKR
jgi:predicted transcriptional regulator